MTLWSAPVRIFPSKIREKILKLEPDIGRSPRTYITSLVILYLSPEIKMYRYRQYLLRDLCNCVFFSWCKRGEKFSIVPRCVCMYTHIFYIQLRNYNTRTPLILLLRVPQNLTRALLGGGGRLNAPLRFFEASENTAARSAAGFSPTLPLIIFATFVKMSTQCHVRSGHQVRSSDPTTK